LDVMCLVVIVVVVMMFKKPGRGRSKRQRTIIYTSTAPWSGLVAVFVREPGGSCDGCRCLVGGPMAGLRASVKKSPPLTTLVLVEARAQPISGQPLAAWHAL